MPDLKALDALSAYNQALKRQQGIGENGLEAGTASPPAGIPDFATVLEEAVRDTIAKVDVAENASMNAAAGQGEIIDMVTAITNAELTLETVVAIRDKVISAYQDIIKMPI